MIEDLTNPTINDIRIVTTRIEGVWKVEFTGFPTPKDLHQSQKYISLQYAHYRRTMLISLGKSNSDFKKKQAEIRIELRELDKKKQELGELNNGRREREQSSSRGRSVSTVKRTTEPRNRDSGEVGEAEPTVGVDAGVPEVSKSSESGKED